MAQRPADEHHMRRRKSKDGDRVFHKWFAQIAVPIPLREIIGQATIEESLNTSSKELAKERRDAFLRRHKDTFKRLALGLPLPPEEEREMLQEDEARMGRELLANPFRTDEDVERERFLRYNATERRESIRQRIIARGYVPSDDHVKAYDLKSEKIEDRAVARDKALQPPVDAPARPTPLLTQWIDTWLAESDIEARQRTDYKRAVNKFGTWLEENKNSTRVGAITRVTAGAYISHLLAQKMNLKTLKKDKSGLSGYWYWLVEKGHADDNIWLGHLRGKSKASKAARRIARNQKRPYTDEEMRKLLNGDAGETLADAIRVLSLQGCRANELAMMTVGRCANGIMRIDDAKTPAGERDVPIHPDVKAIIERRCAGKRSSDFLFSELPTPKKDSVGERSQWFTKHFGRYRLRLKIDEHYLDEHGRRSRQSRVDLHSLRRWFIAKARNALESGATGFTPWTLADVVGHDKEAVGLAMTMGLYPGRSSAEAMRACVESVRLPQ